MHHITLQIEPPIHLDDEALTEIRESLAMAVEDVINRAVRVDGFTYSRSKQALMMRMTTDYAPPDAELRLGEVMRDRRYLDVTAVTVVNADEQMRMEG